MGESLVGIEESKSFTFKDPFDWFVGIITGFTEIFRDNYYVNTYHLFNHFNQGDQLPSI